MKTLQKLAAPFVICGFVLLFATGNIEGNSRMLGVFFCLAVELIAFGIVFLTTSMFVQTGIITTATNSPSTPSSRRIEFFYPTFDKKKVKKSKAPVQVQPKKEKIPFDDQGWREVYELTEHYKNQ